MISNLLPKVIAGGVIGGGVVVAALTHFVQETLPPAALVKDAERRYGAKACERTARRLGNTLSRDEAYFDAWVAPNPPATAIMQLCDGKSLGLSFFRSPPQCFYWAGGSAQRADLFPGACLADGSATEIVDVNATECLWTYPFGTMYMGKDTQGRVVYACTCPPLPWGTEYDGLAEGPLQAPLMVFHRLYARVIVVIAAYTLRGLGKS
jgi:hypothetical protein